ncbi:23S rRNA (uracil(1939)-C(5))-methyltransferase RlmD [Mycoplasmopsis lipofaciens]|uniref:23S rRNA (uracil(1939)-C(5))-methyltransferase RlmD n=1 Tax=Mycoplasmopsis lipofaciens TaxID=114884 RepID=UPI000486FE44|nr:23S rRNA (uracil(1939)-C(5))-methyltransferase RlmD [Mycoplasmopsis lipofaciens]
MQYKENQIIKNVTASKLTYEGLGLVQIENYSIFVENMLPDEVANIQLKKVNSKFGFAKVIDLIKKSSQRIDIKNKQLAKTGAASLLHLSYSDQLKFKYDIVNNLFTRNLHFNKTQNTYQSQKQWNYRNKLTVFVEKINNKNIIGLYEKNTHKIVEQNKYDLAHFEIEKILIWLQQKINEYDFFIGTKNKLNKITIRYSESYNQLMVILETNNKINIDNSFIENIKSAFPNLHSLLQVFKIKNKYKCITYINNKDFIKDKIDNIDFLITWDSFFQVNSFQINNLYNCLLDNLNLKNDDIVLDAYSGIGTISLKTAKKVHKVYGLEIVPNAVINAKNNAQLNNIDNAYFFAGDVIKTIDKIKDKINIVIVDPPRLGLSTQFINKIIQIEPREIGYISCNPNTLCRDSDILLKHGYELIYLKPFDMFCQTHHIECVAIFKKVKH